MIFSSEKEKLLATLAQINANVLISPHLKHLCTSSISEALSWLDQAQAEIALAQQARREQQKLMKAKKQLATLKRDLPEYILH